MKQLHTYLFAICIVLIAITACNRTTSVSNSGELYGEAFEAEKAMNMNALETTMTKYGGATDIVLSGEVDKVCKKKGCWMTLKKDDGSTMRVTFKDYGFFVPLDVDGKRVTIKGNAYYDTTSVDMLRHYAEDEGLPISEINKITEPEIDIGFEATGVYLD